MAIKEEVLAAVRTIRQYCKEANIAKCAFECPLIGFCGIYFDGTPDEWPDPEEGGGGDV